jgi:mannose-6-phosphate isomerase-like protein (cupin superfamily)
MKVKKHVVKRPLIIFFALSLMSILNSHAQDKTTEEILQAFVESYKTDHMAHTVTFGVLVENDWWYVEAKRKQEGYKAGKKEQYTFHNFSPHEVSLQQGMPSTPTWYFHFANKTVLDNIDQQKWTAATASAKSFGTDVVGLNIRDMDGFSSGIKEDAIAYEVMEHFWKKGEAEITYFKRDGSLPTHGVDHVGLYTMKDKRIGWFSIGPEQAANTQRGLDKGQVPNLFIITKGKGKADFGDEMVDLEPGMSVFIPQYVKHVIYNPYEEPLEGILVLFGDNIDYARGKSYMDFLELQHEFYQSYDQEITSNLKQ